MHHRYMYVNGEDYVETAKLLGIKRTTAWGIVRRYQLYGQVNRPRGGARYRKVDQEMIDQMIATVEEHPEFTLSQINLERSNVHTMRKRGHCLKVRKF